MRLLIEVSYDGGAFHGWQIQPNAHTVQEELEVALSRVLKTKIGIHGSSRTDTGVHARQQFAHFDIDQENELDLNHIIWKLNSALPQTIAVKGLWIISEEKHTRFDALYRKYIYRIHLQKNPFVIQNSLYFRKELDFEAMNNAAKELLQHQDFQCFSKVKTEVNNFNCNITEAEWMQSTDGWEFHISANRFLRGMVRAIVGTLFEVGLGKIDHMKFREIIESRKRINAGSAAAAHGLTLEEVAYPSNYAEDDKKN